MIGSLTGRIELRNDPHLIVDVHGVGYKVYASQGVLSRSSVGSEVKVYTYTHVREDAIELYGFHSIEDLRLFEHLISVSGVGCKSAIGVFSVGERQDIVKAVVSGDVTFFTSVPRLGKKNAQKIIIELRPKLGSLTDLDLAAEDGSSEGEEVVQALQAFGFSSREAVTALRAVQDTDATTSEKVRLALKYLGK